MSNSALFAWPTLLAGLILLAGCSTSEKIPASVHTNPPEAAVPVRDSFCSLIVGGWGGSLLGISSLDHMDASENETTKFMNFEQGRWYRIRLRVTERRIEVWVDKEKLVNVDISDKQISLRPGDIELSKPFGIAAWQTTAAVREIRMRSVAAPAGPLKRAAVMAAPIHIAQAFQPRDRD